MSEKLVGASLISAALLVLGFLGGRYSADSNSENQASGDEFLAPEERARLFDGGEGDTLTSSGGSGNVVWASKFFTLGGIDLTDIRGTPDFSSTRFSNLKLSVEDGRFGRDELRLLGKLFAEKWPVEGWQYLCGFHPNVLEASGIRASFLEQLGNSQPHVAKNLINDPQVELSESELYSFGLGLFKSDKVSLSMLADLDEKDASVIASAELESVLRAEGKTGMISWLNNRPVSSVLKVSENEDFFTEQSGVTTRDIENMFELSLVSS